MNKAKEMAQEISQTERRNPETDDDRVGRIGEGAKVQINSLCMEYMPASLSIQDADTLALVMVDMLIDPYKYLKP